VETANFIREIGRADGAGKDDSAEYEDDSQVIQIHRSDGEGLCFMPFGLYHTALILSWEPGSAVACRGGFHVEWSRPIGSQRPVQVFGMEMHLLKFDGIEESLLLIPLGGKRDEPAQPQQVLATSLGWAFIFLEHDQELEETVGELKPLAREIEEVERWRSKLTVQFTGDKGRHLWRQSEVMLRMGQSREPNRPGRYGNRLIVVCLPDGVYFTPWVRDMAYAVVALARLGHQSEARAGLLAYFNARPTGIMRAETAGADYQISVARYFGDGTEDPFSTEEGATKYESARITW